MRDELLVLVNHHNTFTGAPLSREDAERTCDGVTKALSLLMGAAWANPRVSAGRMILVPGYLHLPRSVPDDDQPPPR